jgi:hypothetical protein
MDMQEVKRIVANPHHDPADIVKFYLSQFQYLEEWLSAKGKAYAGVSIDCSQCVMSTYLSEKLTIDGFEVERVEFTNRMAEVSLEECNLDVALPDWVQRFIKAIDGRSMHDQRKQRDYAQNKIYSDNLARNILRVTLENMPITVE